ncbi:hypothetical protein METP1_03209 [Methanosarcinales archaeon]|nr:hypothetical protein METP1_03209 [Methanosarcinales archaeon]
MMIINIMLILKNMKQIRNNRSNHCANSYYLIAVIIFSLVFFSSLAYATEDNSSHDYNASSNTTNTTNSSTSHIHSNKTANSSLHVHPDTNLSVAFFMKDAGEQIKVNIEDFGIKNPLASEPHGFPVRFFKANAQNISYETLTINASYSEMELEGMDEDKLVISQHEHNNSTWIMLPTIVNKEGNTLETTTDSLSLFAISSHSGNSSEHIYNNTAEIINNSSHNHMDNETKPISVSFIGSGNTKIALELDSRNIPDSPLPGSPIKFFRIDARNLSYYKVNIEVAYPDTELNGTDENNLSILHYANSTWTKLPTEINGDKNTVSASVDSLSLFAISSFSGGGQNMSMDMGIVSDCLRCHGSRTNYSGGMMEEMTPKVNENIMNGSIHADLNNASSDLNRACWACHSNSTTPPAKHPMHNPALTCTSCHIEDTLNLTKKLKPNHLTRHTAESSQVKAAAACILCHNNDVSASGKTINSTVSHYAKYPAVDTKDCVSCHQNKEIGKKWSSPPDPRETVRLANVEKKLVSDEIWKLDQNYSIAISEADKEGQSARIELYYNAKPVKKELVTEGDTFKYDTKLVEDGANKTIIDLGISDIFYGKTVSLVTFRGFVPKHIHTETSVKSIT